MARKKSPSELKEEGAAIGEQIATARKRPVNFALQIGKDGLVLETDIKKNPDILWRNAKKNGGGPKGAKGTMTVRGKVIELDCVDDSAPNQLPKLAKKWLTERGQAFMVVMKTPSGDVGDEEDNEEEALKVASSDTDEAPEQPAARNADALEVASSDTDEAPEQPVARRADAPANHTDEAPEQPAARNADAPASAGQEDDATGPPPGLSEPIKLGAEPAKRDVAEEFNAVRKDLMKVMGQLEGDARAGLQEQISQFGQLMKSKDYKGAQSLMDDLAVSQNTVTEPQRGRARDEIAQIDSLMGDIEAEMDALEEALSQHERSIA